MQSKAVADRVESYLRNGHVDGISIEVDPNSVRWEGSWWQVRVRASQDPPQLFRYFEALAGVEAALEERDHLKVFLAPGEPEQPPVHDEELPAGQPFPNPGAQPRLSKKVVAEKVSAYLQDCHPGGVTLRVDPKHLSLQNRVWRVPVKPDAEPPNLMEYYEALADVEIALEEREHLKVWLVTADPQPLHRIQQHSSFKEKSAADDAMQRRAREPKTVK
jgi:hypothetical protein